MTELSTDIRAQLSKPLVLLPSNVDDIQVRKGLVYKEVDNLELLLDIYQLPNPQSREKRPAIIFLHGGVTMTWLDAFSPREWGQYKGWGQLVASAGFVGVVTTRRSEFNEAWKFTHGRRAVDDATDVFTYLNDHANELGIDMNRVAIWSCSAGVPIGIVTGTRQQVRCIVAYYGIMDLATADSWLPDGDTTTVVASWSPLRILERMTSTNMPPLQIVLAGKDTSEINTGILNFVTKAVEQNQPIEFIVYPEGEHGFDVFNDTNRSRQVIQRTLEFLREWM